MSVVTRFAPSPTGFLHIGGARTALFNWLFARHHGGTFRLRIEDTDRARSTEEAKAAILDGLTWLGLDWDGTEVYQSTRAVAHVAAAQHLLAEGKAYHCFCSQEELAEMRRRAREEGRFTGYDGRWRDRDPADAPEGVAPTLRFKAPREGETKIKDGVQGEVRVANDQLDDMVLLRADGTPTYMLSVVVDDHDMDVSHVIRGDDHLTNAFRQNQLYLALGWTPPVFAHIPLIHGADGAKLSKRHGALGVDAYRDMGILPEALRNYLLRLGWSHGDDEIISMDQAISWFDLPGINKAAARFDAAKLNSLNAHYLREADSGRLLDLIRPLLEKRRGSELRNTHEARLLTGLPGLVDRSKTLLDLADNAYFYVSETPLDMDDKAKKILDDAAREQLADLLPELKTLESWNAESIEAVIRRFAESKALKLGQVAQPLRAALTGRSTSPGIFEVMQVLEKDDTLLRITLAAAK